MNTDSLAFTIQIQDANLSELGSTMSFMPIKAYRITHTASDALLTTCYNKDNAELICAALNLLFSLTESILIIGHTHSVRVEEMSDTDLRAVISAIELLKKSPHYK